MKEAKNKKADLNKKNSINTSKKKKTTSTNTNEKKKKKRKTPAVKKDKKDNNLKWQIFSILFFELIGVILCLLFLFVLSGGQNFIKLYKELNKLINVYDTITTDYYGELDKDALIDNAIESMINSIDDSFTTYTDEESTDAFLENIEGTYEGIGCTVSINENGNIYVVNIFNDSPAEDAGLQEGDIILKVDNQDYTEKASEEMSEYVKNSGKDEVKLTIQRDNDEKEITIVRRKVEIPSVLSKTIEKEGHKIGYVDISIFSSVTYEQFKKQLEELEKENIEGLIIDVRNDTGGYLSTVTDISSLFLKKGQVIYQLEDNDKKEKVKDKTKEYRQYPIAVLINNYSASASEILASAIKESYTYDSFIVGTNSYGKGTVQKTKELSDGSMIKYTTQKWLTPDGNWINNEGLEPTNYIEYKSQDNIPDNQLDEATNLIYEKIK